MYPAWMKYITGGGALKFPSFALIPVDSLLHVCIWSYDLSNSFSYCQKIFFHKLLVVFFNHICRNVTNVALSGTS